MLSLFKKVKVASQNRTTYRVGLLQTKAYRILKQTTDHILSKFDMSAVHWAFMGVLEDNIKGMRSNELATELKVEAPFVTTIAADLRDKGYLLIKNDPTDNRAKILLLTAKGRKFVETTEPLVRAGMRPLLKDIPPGDVMTYIYMLEKIIKNSGYDMKE